ncbi:MAG: hypothetical protein EPN38_09330 [Rhodanobacteraceae bacterium]|nr:MAG: hypothetical protein EPN38_09330 [Rhodanobacteraceae bacterium]
MNNYINSYIKSCANVGELHVGDGTDVQVIAEHFSDRRIVSLYIGAGSSTTMVHLDPKGAREVGAALIAAAEVEA